MLSVTNKPFMLNIHILNITNKPFMLNVTMLGVIMLSVVAPNVNIKVTQLSPL